MLHRLFLVLFLLIQSAVMWSQSYVYSVTSGTSWARDVFPKCERQERNIRKGTPMIEGAPNFERTFIDLRYDYQKYHQYNDSIFVDLSHEDWISMFSRRARRYSDMFAKNNQRITELRDYFDGDLVEEAAYDSLYYWTRHLYHRNINDIYLIEQLLDILLPHYEQKQDLEHLVFCYMCAGMCNYQSSRMGDRNEAEKSELYYQKVVNMREQFASFADPLNRFYLIAAYVNLAVMHSHDGNMSLVQSQNLTESMKKIYSQPETMHILQQDSLLNTFANWSIELWNYRSIMTYISRSVNNPQLCQRLYDKYVEQRNAIKGDFRSLPNRYYAKLEYDDLLIEAFMGHITYDQALDRFEKLLSDDPEMQSSTGAPVIKINYLNNLFESHLYLINHSSMSHKDKQQRVVEILHHVLDVLTRYEHGRYPFEKGMILANFATQPELLKYLDEQQRSDLLFRLIVLEQPITYVHVSMVAALARILTEGMIEAQPEYFVGLPGYTSVEEVRAKRDSLLDYTWRAAIFHDVGKISMPSVVNNCFRKLTQHEIDIIQLHPTKSRPFFDISPELAQYSDIALGHHKWYDGDGYPESFRNRRSPYFPIINIVTICDCMDAATENIGRNYHHPKQFETVMEEFYAEAGTRYDPTLASFIRSNTSIYEQMKQTVLTARYDFYYQLYTGYLKKD